MPNLSNAYSVKYKTRNFSQNGIKNANRLKLFNKHYYIPDVMIGSKVNEYHDLWDFLSINTVEDTTFKKTHVNYRNAGWEICSQINYGLGVPDVWDCYASYDGSKTYDHRIEVPDASGNYITESFSFDRIIRIDSTMSPSEGSSFLAGSDISFTGVVIGDADFTGKLKIEFENENISDMIFDFGLGLSLGNLYYASVFTLPDVSQIENAVFIFEVTWEDGQIQKDEVNFDINPAPGT